MPNSNPSTSSGMSSSTPGKKRARPENESSSESEKSSPRKKGSVDTSHGRRTEFHHLYSEVDRRCLEYHVKKNLTDDDVKKLVRYVELATREMRTASEIISENLPARQEAVGKHDIIVKIGRHTPPKSVVNHENLSLDDLLDKFLTACNRLKNRFIEIATRNTSIGQCGKLIDAQITATAYIRALDKSKANFEINQYSTESEK